MLLEEDFSLSRRPMKPPWDLALGTFGEVDAAQVERADRVHDSHVAGLRVDLDLGESSATDPRCVRPKLMDGFPFPMPGYRSGRRAAAALNDIWFVGLVVS